MTLDAAHAPRVVEQGPAAARVAPVGEGEGGVIVRLQSSTDGREQRGEVTVACVDGPSSRTTGTRQGARSKAVPDLRPHVLADGRKGLATLVAHPGVLRRQALEVNIQRAGIGHAGQGGERLRPRLRVLIRLQQSGYRGLYAQRPQGMHGVPPDPEVRVAECQDQGFLGLVPADPGQGAHRGGTDFRVRGG